MLCTQEVMDAVRGDGQAARLHGMWMRWMAPPDMALCACVTPTASGACLSVVGVAATEQFFWGCVGCVCVSLCVFVRATPTAQGGVSLLGMGRHYNRACLLQS